jgi:hypothetical protein
MSVNEIDVNAVNKRALDAMKVVAPPLPEMPTAGSTIPIQNINRWRAKYYYFVLDVFLFMESIIWTLMDFIRSRRMRWANKIKDATDQTKA